MSRQQKLDGETTTEGEGTMIELPDRIRMAESYADSISGQSPAFWWYAQDEIQRWRNGYPSVHSDVIAQTGAGRNLRAILRGETRWPV